MSNKKALLFIGSKSNLLCLFIKNKIYKEFFLSKKLDDESKEKIKDIFKKYNEVDFAITRSGASTISELIYFNIPFLAIPLPKSKDNHQFYNAKDYFDKNLCWLASQTEYKKENLKENLILCKKIW